MSLSPRRLPQGARAPARAPGDAALPRLPGRHGPVNWLGLWAHTKRGLMVYTRYAAATIGGPLVAGLLFLAVFSIALGGSGTAVGGVSYSHFLVPGIGMMIVLNQSFEQAAFLILDDKLEGMIADSLMAPLSPLEIMTGYVAQATATALLTGGLLLTVMLALTGTPVVAPLSVLGYAVLGAALFALIGTIAGLWADRWEQFSAVESFLVLPLSILSGTFFSLEGVPQVGRQLMDANPVFYLVDGFRAGFTGSGEAAAGVGIPLLLCLIVALWCWGWRLFAIGYKLKP